MKRILAFIVCLLFMSTNHVYAQSSAQPVLPGYLQAAGCPSLSPCYQYQATPVNSSTTEANHVLKTSAGTLFGLSVTSSVSGYVLIYNATSAPTDGAVTPIACYYLSSGPGTLGIAFTPFPLKFSTGITVVFSTTGCFTQTSSATAFFLSEII